MHGMASSAFQLLAEKETGIKWQTAAVRWLLMYHIPLSAAVFPTLSWVWLHAFLLCCMNWARARKTVLEQDS
jgi:hypothetical protein